MKLDVLNRFTGNVQFTAEIDCDERKPKSFKLGLAVRWGFRSGADLEGAYLEGADLKGADLEGANLEAPSVENIHQKTLAAVEDGKNLEMGSWHGDCGTTHCRAGWYVTLAGEEGQKLEQKVGTAVAGYAILHKSDPDMDGPINFYASNDDAMAELKRLAAREAAA